MSEDFNKMEENVNYLKETLKEIRENSEKMQLIIKPNSEKLHEILEEKSKTNLLEYYANLTEKLESLKVNKDYKDFAE